MLGNLFPNLFSNGEPGNTSLSTGSNPQKLGGNEKSEIASYTTLPNWMTKEQVMTAAKKAGELEAQTVILKEGSEQYLEVQKAALANLEVRVNHSKQAMKNTRDFEKKMSKHGKNIYEYQLGNEATKQNFDAYEAQFNAIKVDI